MAVIIPPVTYLQQPVQPPEPQPWSALIEKAGSVLSYATLALPFLSPTSSLFKLGALWDDTLMVRDGFKNLRSGSLPEIFSETDLFGIILLMGGMFFNLDFPILWNRSMRVGLLTVEKLDALKRKFFKLVRQGNHEAVINLLASYKRFASHFIMNNPIEVVGKLVCDDLGMAYYMARCDLKAAKKAAVAAETKIQFLQEQSYYPEIEGFCTRVTSTIKEVFMQDLYDLFFINTKDRTEHSNIIRGRRIAVDVFAKKFGTNVFLDGYFEVLTKYITTFLSGRPVKNLLISHVGQQTDLYLLDYGLGKLEKSTHFLPENWVLLNPWGRLIDKSYATSVQIPGLANPYRLHIFEPSPVIKGKRGLYKPYAPEVHHTLYEWLKRNGETLDGHQIHVGRYWVALPEKSKNIV